VRRVTWDLLTFLIGLAILTPCAGVFYILWRFQDQIKKVSFPIGIGVLIIMLAYVVGIWVRIEIANRKDRSIWRK
jgi:hypothetical protein